MGNSSIRYGQPVGIFSEEFEIRLDIGNESTLNLVDASTESDTTRFTIRRLDGPNEGEIEESHLVGLFSESGMYRLDIGDDCVLKKTPPEIASNTTVLVFQPSGGKSAAPMRYGEVVGVFSSDYRYRLDVSPTAMKILREASHDSWATRLHLKAVSPLDPAQPEPPAPTPPTPEPPPPEPPEPHSSEEAGTTLESILVAVYEGVKRAQVHVQRGLERKIDWYFPTDEHGISQPRMVRIPILQADGAEVIRDIPLFALAPHHDLMLDELTVRMRVDLLNLKPSTGNQAIQEIESRLARDNDRPELFADIEIHLKGTEPTEGIARLNDEIIKRI